MPVKLLFDRGPESQEGNTPHRTAKKQACPPPNERTSPLSYTMANHSPSGTPRGMQADPALLDDPNPNAKPRQPDRQSSRYSRNTAYDALIHQGAASWSPDKEKILFGPFDYLFGHPGKDVRAQLIAAFNAWLQVPKESLAIITKVVGMLHTASLLWGCSCTYKTLQTLTLKTQQS